MRVSYDSATRTAKITTEDRTLAGGPNAATGTALRWDVDYDD